MTRFAFFFCNTCEWWIKLTSKFSRDLHTSASRFLPFWLMQVSSSLKQDQICIIKHKINAPIQSTYSTCLTDLEVFKESARAMCSAPSSPRWLHPNLAMGNKNTYPKIKMLNYKMDMTEITLTGCLQTFLSLRKSWPALEEPLLWSHNQTLCMCLNVYGSVQLYITHTNVELTTWH